MKAKPREFWINVYLWCRLTPYKHVGTAHKSAKLAEAGRANDREFVETIHVREVRAVTRARGEEVEVKVSNETWFVADDGVRFKDEAGARAHDAWVARVKDALAEMPPVVDRGCGFANGDGFKTWPADVVERCREKVLALIREKHPDINGFPSYYGFRVLDDSGSDLYGPALRLWHHIDNHSREWGQTYYANNPHEGKQVEWSPQ